MADVQVDVNLAACRPPYLNILKVCKNVNFRCFRSSTQTLRQPTLIISYYPLNHFFFLMTLFPSSVQFSCLVVSNSATPWTAAYQASLSIANSQGLLKPMSVESVMPSNHLILCCPLLLLPQSLPASGSFPMSQLFTSAGQSTEVSASALVLPMNTQD